MIKRSITVQGHRTSIALEAEFWAVLESVAQNQKITLPVLIATIDQTRLSADLANSATTPSQGLASALRVYALNAVAGKCSALSPPVEQG